MDKKRERPLPFLHWLFGKGHLKTVTFIPFFVLVMVSLSLSWIISYASGKRTMDEMIGRLTSEITMRIDETLTSYLEVPHARNSATLSLLQLNPDLRNDLPSLFRYLQQQLIVNPALNIVALGTEDGEYVEAQRQEDGVITFGTAGVHTGQGLELWYTDADGFPLDQFLQRPDYDPRSRPWYASSREAGAPTWSSIYPYYSNQELAISANRPVYMEIRKDHSGRELFGVLSATFTLRDLGSFLRTINTGENGYTLIAEPDGNLVAASTQELLIDPESGNRLHISGSSIPIIARSADLLSSGEKKLRVRSGLSRYIILRETFNEANGLSWNVFIILDEADFVGPIIKSNQQTAILLVSIFILTLLIGWGIANYISYPIIQLNEATRLLSSRDYKKPVPFLPSSLLDRNDDIGKLAVAFDKMTDHLESTLSILKKSLAEKETLIQEIHHRVKNNLQIICSILNLQCARITDQESRIHFEVSQERIYLLALLHEELYQTEDFSNFDLASYLYKLRDEIRTSHAEQLSGILITTKAEEIFVSIEKAIPIGLIFHELLTNAVKHAHPEGGPGNIIIEIQKSDEHMCQISVTDDGIGIPDLEACTESGSIGFQMINSLSGQLGGVFEISRNNGVQCSIAFPFN